MLKFKDVSQEQRGEVVRLASEIYDTEQVEQREHTSTVAAAEEIGLPEEYLERAAQALQEKRIADARQKRTSRARFLMGGGIVAALGVGAFLLRPAPPATPFSLSPIAQQPTLSTNTGTEASATSQGDSYVLKVNRFIPTNNRYSANLDLPLPKTSLSGYRQMTFTVRGTGTIPKVRLFLEGGSLNERWKGPDVPVSTTPRQVSLSMDQFIRQERVSNTEWKDISLGRPNEVTRLSIKSGFPVNPATVSGTIGVSKIEFR